MTPTAQEVAKTMVRDTGNSMRSTPWPLARRGLMRALLALFLFIPALALAAEHPFTRPDLASTPLPPSGDVTSGHLAEPTPGLTDMPPPLPETIPNDLHSTPGAMPGAEVIWQPQAPESVRAQPIAPSQASAIPDAAPGEDDKQEPSALERIYRERYDSALSAGLIQFGYEFFSTRPSLELPSAPSDPAYVLGPGDVLGVRLTGMGLERELSVPVNREGGLDVPGMGVVDVAGLQLAQAEAEVESLARRYSPSAQARLRMLRMRDLEVYVVGEVRRPGLVRVSGRATPLAALLAAGGVKKSGSLRGITISRGETVLARVDLYSLLLHGRLAGMGDVRLASGDVIFVPRIGPTVAVTGAVSAPRIYELAGEKNLSEALALAGGSLPQAESRRVLVRSFSAESGFAIRDLDAARPEALENEPVADGDLLEVRFQPAEWPRTVRLEGHVRQAEEIAWREGLRLSDLLGDPDLLKPGAVMDFGLLKRWDPRSGRWATSAFPLAQVLAGGHDAPLAPHDVVRILSRQEYGMREPVTLRGAVWKPGEYEHAPDMTLVDLLALGGGLRFGADATRIEVSRVRLEPQRAASETMTLDLATARGFTLAPHDTVFVPRIKDATADRRATITGQVRYPGVYRIANGEPLSSLIRRAGGFTPEAYFHGAKFTSPKARQIQQDSLDRLVRELEMWADTILAEQAQTTADPEATEGAREARAGIGKLLSRLREVKAEGRVSIVLAELVDFAGTEHDFALEDGDVLHVPAKPSFVSVVGSVYTPSSFLYRSEASVEDYLTRSGGPTRTADTRHMYVLKANGEVLSMAQAGMSSHRFKSLGLMPGDTLVVPEDLERVPYFRFFRGLTDSLFKIATTAGIALAIL